MEKNDIFYIRAKNFVKENKAKWFMEGFLLGMTTVFVFVLFGAGVYKWLM